MRVSEAYIGCACSDHSSIATRWILFNLIGSS